jgi:hypothetical protein
VLTIRDAENNPIREFNGPSTPGLHRVPWDMRYPGANLGGPRRRGSEPDDDEDFFGFAPAGHYVMPGKYSVTVSKRVNGVVTQLAGPQEFQVKYVGAASLSPDDWKQLGEFQKQLIKLQRELTAVQGLSRDITTKLDAMKSALDQTPNAPADAREKIRKLIAAQRETVRLLSGDNVLAARNENVPLSISQRVGIASGAAQTIVNKPTGTQREQFAIAQKELGEVAATLRKRNDTDLKEMEALLDKLGAPWTPGRLPGGKIDR